MIRDRETEPDEEQEDRQLFRRRWWLELHTAAVGDTESLADLRDLVLDRSRLPRRQIRRGVETLVSRKLLGPVARQAFEEVLAGSGPQEEHVAPEPGRAGFPRGACDVFQKLGLVADPRQHGSDADAHVDA